MYIYIVDKVYNKGKMYNGYFAIPFFGRTDLLADRPANPGEHPAGEASPGTALPSIRQLAKDLQISVITTKRAYNELEQEGLIDSVVGKGSFVAGGNQEFIREQRLRALENKLREVLEECRSIPVSMEELIEWMKLLDSEGGAKK